MPYKVEGNKVLHFKGGKWSVKQTTGSPAKAQAAVRLLRGVEHGWKPTGKRKKKRKHNTYAQHRKEFGE